MSRGARIAVGALGAAFVLAAVTGRGELFVRPWFVPVLLVAGAALLLVAWRGGVHVPHGAAALLLVPVLVGAALPPLAAIPPATAKRPGALGPLDYSISELLGRWRAAVYQ